MCSICSFPSDRRLVTVMPVCLGGGQDPRQRPGQAGLVIGLAAVAQFAQCQAAEVYQSTIADPVFLDSPAAGPLLRDAVSVACQNRLLLT